MHIDAAVQPSSRGPNEPEGCWVILRYCDLSRDVSRRLVCLYFIFNKEHINFYLLYNS